MAPLSPLVVQTSLSYEETMPVYFLSCSKTDTNVIETDKGDVPIRKEKPS
jgi:hypothetical protein